jgi:hypothetical protein
VELKGMRRQAQRVKGQMGSLRKMAASVFRLSGEHV